MKMKDNEKWDLLERYKSLFRLVVSRDFNNLSCTAQFELVENLTSLEMEIIEHMS